MLITPTPSTPRFASADRSRSFPARGVVVAGLAVALLLVLFVAPHASSSPDGLQKVAADQGIDASVQPHALDESPLARYSVAGMRDSTLSTALAGLAGVVVTGAVGFCLCSLVRRRAVHIQSSPSRDVV